jgi:hypothetical protein
MEAFPSQIGELSLFNTLVNLTVPKPTRKSHCRRVLFVRVGELAAISINFIPFQVTEQLLHSRLGRGSRWCFYR